MTEWRHRVIWSLFTPILPKAHYTGPKALVPSSLYWERAIVFVCLGQEWNESRDRFTKKVGGRKENEHEHISYIPSFVRRLEDGGSMPKRRKWERNDAFFAVSSIISKDALTTLHHFWWNMANFPFGSEEGSDASLLLPPNTCQILCNSRCL